MVYTSLRYINLYIFIAEFLCDYVDVCDNNVAKVDNIFFL
jgi:hypothetical protein